MRCKKLIKFMIFYTNTSPPRAHLHHILTWLKKCLAQGVEPTTRPHEYTFTSDGQKAQVLFAFALMKGGGQCN